MTSQDIQADASAAQSLPSVSNQPGLSALAYRVRTHTRFKAAMVEELARQEPLQRLARAGDDDPSLAMMDAWATALDVLAFYQERIANEGYLRTAAEQRSVQELGRAVGYELNPGVAAETYLAFTVDEGPGAPEKVTIDMGTKVQSVPGPGEQTQVFETVEKIEARPEWNAMRPLLVEAANIFPRHVYLRGISTQLQPGDAVLIVGDEREQHPKDDSDKERWDFRILKTITPDPGKNWTRITWEDDLGKSSIKPAEKNVRVFAFRQRAALFGHNAPDPNLIAASMTSHPSTLFTGLNGRAETWAWTGFSIQGNHIDLDNAYPKILAGSWLALKRLPRNKQERGYVELYRADNVSFPSRAQFALTGKITRIIPDTDEHLADFKLDETIVYAQSEQLELAAPPRTTRADDDPSKPLSLAVETLAPVEGTRIMLDRELPKLPQGRTVIVTGKRMRARVSVNNLALTGTDDTRSRPLRLGETLVVVNSPKVNEDRVTWYLRGDDGTDGTLQTGLDDLLLTTAAEGDAEISEWVSIQECSGYPTLELYLGEPGLQNMFDRPTVKIAANVARATHGETRQEVLGSADAAQSFQQFALRQGPLTFVPADTPSGGTDTLQVRVNDILWDETRTLYGSGPRDRVFTARQGPDGKFIIQFGNGTSGARPPSGDENVSATYRVGLGTAGNVKAGQLRVLLSRPLGVRGVINPQSATGGADPEQAADARLNAACAALTLDRIITLRDYEDFARAFGGVGKARADWLWVGSRGIIVVTVVDAHGQALDQGPLDRLDAAMAAAHDPAQSFQLVTTDARRFCIRARLVLDPHYHADQILEKAKAALRQAFSLTQRDFGQGVTESEILGLIQSVDGIIAVDIEKPYPDDADSQNEWQDHHRLTVPLASATLTKIEPAQLLLLSESADAISLRVVASLSEPEAEEGSGGSYQR